MWGRRHRRPPIERKQCGFRVVVGIVRVVDVGAVFCIIGLEFVVHTIDVVRVLDFVHVVGIVQGVYVVHVVYVVYAIDVVHVVKGFVIDLGVLVVVVQIERVIQFLEFVVEHHGWQVHVHVLRVPARARRRCRLLHLVLFRAR
jgi:hypothetical protein